MSGDKKFDLGDYVEVKDRIAKFYELFGNGRLVTRRVEILSLEDGEYVQVHALAYRTPDDPLPGTGTSWLKIPGQTSYTRGSEVENAETSAWGRAIGSLGILIDQSIASANEVQNKTPSAGESASVGHPPPTPPANGPETEELVGIVERSGMVRNGGAGGYKLEARETPDGHAIGFKLETDKGSIPQVLVAGSAGEALFLATGGNAGALVDTRIHVKGKLYQVKKPGRQGYMRLHVEEWSNADYEYPAADIGLLDEPPADVHLVGERE